MLYTKNETDLMFQLFNEILLEETTDKKYTDGLNICSSNSLAMFPALFTKAIQEEKMSRLEAVTSLVKLKAWENFMEKDNLSTLNEYIENHLDILDVHIVSEKVDGLNLYTIEKVIQYKN